MKQTKGDTVSFTGTLKSPIMTIFNQNLNVASICPFSNQPVNILDICRTRQLAVQFSRKEFTKLRMVFHHFLNCKMFFYIQSKSMVWPGFMCCFVLKNKSESIKGKINIFISCTQSKFGKPNNICRQHIWFKLYIFKMFM